MTASQSPAARLAADWSNNPRWHGVTRPYSAAEVLRLRGSVHIEHTLARLGAEKFWRLLHDESVIGALGCMSGNQAVQAVQAGLKAIYCSGWQVAGDGQFTRASVSRPEPCTGRTRCRRMVRAHQQCPSAAAPTRSQHPRGTSGPHDWLGRRSLLTPRPASAAISNAFELLQGS